MMGWHGFGKGRVACIREIFKAYVRRRPVKKTLVVRNDNTLEKMHAQSAAAFDRILEYQGSWRFYNI